MNDGPYLSCSTLRVMLQPPSLVLNFYGDVATTSLQCESARAAITPSQHRAVRQWTQREARSEHIRVSWLNPALAWTVENRDARFWQRVVDVHLVTGSRLVLVDVAANHVRKQMV